MAKCRERLHILFLAGICHLSLHNYHEAEACFGGCLPLQANSHLAWYRRGLCRLKLKDYDGARKDFEHVVRLKPDFNAALVGRALALDGQGRWQEAVADLTQAIDEGFPETRLFFMRSRICTQLGESANAARDRQEGLNRDPVDAASWVARGVARLADNPENALADFREAIRVNPHEFEAYRNIAHVLSERLNQPQEAIDTLDRVLAMTADDPLTWSGRGVLHARLGHCAAALADADQAVAVRRDPLVLYQVACVHSLCAGSAGTIGPAIAGSKADKLLKTVLPLLAEAFRLDSGLARIATDDDDLKNVHGYQPFQQLVTAAEILRLARDPGAIPAVSPARGQPD
ncbi:MAG: tetratricopeptide repeat protein [Planctomycetales bacterium]